MLVRLWRKEILIPSWLEYKLVKIIFKPNVVVICETTNTEP